MTVTDQASDLLRFIDSAPSPYHAVAEVTRRLDRAGFTPLGETARWAQLPGSYYVVRGGSLVAWVLDEPTVRQGDGASGGFRIVGAHTDSPNLRVKPHPDTGSAGFRQLGVEVYGGPLLNSWLDRDLGLSGRVALRGDGTTPTVELVRIDEPLLRIPQLAIHLDRGVNENGLKLNPQAHLEPVWGLGPSHEGAFVELLATELQVHAADVVSWEVMLHDLTPSTLAGASHEFISAPRLDNLASCHAAISALSSLAPDLGSPDAAAAQRSVPVVCLFDHEEIGSQSASGADGSLLPTILERVATMAGSDRDGFHRALAASLCVSADGAHATHPNYVERHEPNHQVHLNGGPVLKVNSNVRYASDTVSSAWLQLVADRAGVALQRFVSRNDLACGSTIGPVTAARLGVPTVDVGMAQLAMHSVRELCGSADPEAFARLLRTFLSS